jgi:tetratricopeptide (TPR) repeat protein
LCLAGFAVSCDDPSQKEARYLRTGTELFEKGEFQKARVEFGNAAKIKPADPEPIYRLGLVSESLGDLFNAYNRYIAAANQDARFAPARLKLAEYALESDQLDLAEGRLHEVLALYPEDPVAHALTASLLIRRGDLAGADREARLSLAEDPNSLRGVAALVGIAIARHDSSGAAGLLDAAIAAHPDSIPLRHLAVSTYGRLDDLPRLESADRALFGMAPPARAEREDLARRYIGLGRLDDAEAILRAGLQAAPGDPELSSFLIDFLATHRDRAAATAELTAAAAANPGDPETGFRFAALDLRFDDTDGATAKLEQIAAKAARPADRHRAIAVLARLRLAQGHTDEALSLLAPVLDEDPGFRDALYLRASIAFDRGAYEKSSTDLRAILKTEPGDADAGQLLAETLLRQGHPDLAIDTLTDVVERNPTDRTALVRLAQYHHLTGGSDRALEILRLVTASRPDYAPGWETTARIAEDLKNWDEAKRAIEGLRGLDGQKALAQFLEGRLLAGRDRPAEALQAFVAVANAEPNGALAENAVDAIIELERAKGALPAALGLIRPLPVAPGIRAGACGRIEVELGRTAEATADLDAAIAAETKRPDIYTMRALIATHAGQPDMAIATLRQGLARAPADRSIPMLLGQILRNTGKFDAAIAIYGDLVDRDPGLDPAVNALAATIADHAYSDTAALDRARKAAERFRVSDNIDYLDSLAWVYYRQGALGDAISLFERAARLGALAPVVHYHYAMVLIAAGRRDDARRELTAAVADGPDYPERAEAKRMLGMG